MDDLSGRHALIRAAEQALALRCAGAAHAGAQSDDCRPPERALEETASRHERMRWVTGDVSDPRSVLSMFTEQWLPMGRRHRRRERRRCDEQVLLKMDASDCGRCSTQPVRRVPCLAGRAAAMLDAGWAG